MAYFEPIAIIGQACTLPGAMTPQELWQLSINKQDCLSNFSADYVHMVVNNAEVKHSATEFNIRGGCLPNFLAQFNPNGFAIAAKDIQSLDLPFLLALHTARAALNSAHYSLSTVAGTRCGAIFGNLSYPGALFSRFAELNWLEQIGTPFFCEDSLQKIQQAMPDARNAYMSGLPAHILAKALNLNQASFTIDAACASALYAIKLACDALQSGNADLMLAGAINGVEHAFLHTGFAALQALSINGQSRPFQGDANGLVPSIGAGFLLLKRLNDAVTAGDNILGVVRAVGLSNDGNQGSTLLPDKTQQMQAMLKAYHLADLEPDDIDFIECHATGTSSGDKIELASMQEVFPQYCMRPVAALKANLGHLLGASGVAATIRSLMAMRAGMFPPTPYHSALINPLNVQQFRLLKQAEAWPEHHNLRRAAINCFGFGGNNAHMLLESWPGFHKSLPKTKPTPLLAQEDIAIIGIGVYANGSKDLTTFTQQVLGQPTGQAQQTIRADNDIVANISLPANKIHIPPADLQAAFGEQLSLLALTYDLVSELPKALNSDTTAVFMGMQCSPDSARWNLRAQLANLLSDYQTAGNQAFPVMDSEWLNQLKTAIAGKLTAADVLGCMPNVVTNRLNQQFDCRAASFSVSSEELSGIDALNIACHALRQAEIDTAIVGAADMCCEPVRSNAMQKLFPQSQQIPADGAVVLLLQCMSTARAQGNKIYAVLPATKPRSIPISWGNQNTSRDLTPILGYAHCALGLTHVAAAALSIYYYHQQPAHQKSDVISQLHWLDKTAGYHAEVVINALGGRQESIYLQATAPQQESMHTELQQQQQSGKLGLQQLLISYAVHKPAIKFAPPAAAIMMPKGLPGRLTSIVNAHQQFITTQMHLHQQYLSTQTQICHQWMLITQEQQSTKLHEFMDSNNSSVTLQEIPPKDNNSLTPQELSLPLSTLQLSRQDLEGLSHGKISAYFGPLFIQQDQYYRQVRMPEPPLLLADRVVKIIGEPGTLGLGVIYTETDVTSDAWYLYAGRMPAGIMIESGQADLLLISWLGIDFHNQSKRVYRLLGCELTYFGELPKPGDTLCFDIHIDGYAQQGEVRLFFFHYDCKINGDIRMQVRNGQAGFFSDEELRHSQGVLWDTASAEYQQNPRLDSPSLQCTQQTFNTQQLQAFAAGDVIACFGKEFYLAQTHTRTPSINGGRMLFLHEITDLAYNGGPKKRGYMRAVQYIQADDWFFAGHFKNDPCMPGTLMVEAGIQLMACYLTACGFTLNKDGWRFQPVNAEKYVLRCRGQVIPSSRQVIYEIFVDELIAAPYPTLYVHLLGTVDGLKGFHTRMGLQLVPDWPLSTKSELLNNYQEPKPVACSNGFSFDYASLLACAWGNPLDAFGNLFKDYSPTRRMVRLPGPPYHFMSRVLAINATMKQADIGANITIEYDIPSKAWYFFAGKQHIMPFCVLMEITLQPCGWLSVYTGNTLRSEEDLFFRNLDGTAQIYHGVTAQDTNLQTQVTLEKISYLSNTIIVGFSVTCSNAAGIKVYSMDTVFGFFPGAAFAHQAGLPTTACQQALLDQASDFYIDLGKHPADYFAGQLTLPSAPLLMLHRITGYWRKQNNTHCQIRAEKDINPNDWYFKAHFYQDPVQPGSLGIEALLQLLQFYMLHETLADDIKNPVFSPLLEHNINWKYRGQVTPDNKRITLLLDIIEQGNQQGQPYVLANGTLWVDGKCIYSVQGLGLEIISF